MAKSAWMIHLAKYRKEHPGMSVPDTEKEAAKTYKKQRGDHDLAATNVGSNKSRSMKRMSRSKKYRSKTGGVTRTRKVTFPAG